MPEASLRAIGLIRTAPPNAHFLLDRVDLRLHAGECAAIVGPSGSGKTVLLRALAWLDPLDAGEVTFGGRTPRQIGVPEFRRRVMYLHQSAWLPEGDVASALRQPYQLGVYAKEQAEAASSQAALLERLDTLGRKDSLLNQQTGDLSGGERQMVAILRAMQLSPIVLLLDEPMSALDDETQSRCERLIMDWLREIESRSVLIITHDQQQAKRMAGRTLRMNSGRLEGDPAR